MLGTNCDDCVFVSRPCLRYLSHLSEIPIEVQSSVMDDGEFAVTVEDARNVRKQFGEDTTSGMSRRVAENSVDLTIHTAEAVRSDDLSIDARCLKRRFRAGGRPDIVVSQNYIDVSAGRRVRAERPVTTAEIEYRFVISDSHGLGE